MFQRTPYLIIQQLCLLTIFVISFNCREAVAQAKISTEGELRSIRDAGFDYDDLTDSSGNTEIDNRVKEVIDFVNNDGFIRSFSLTMKFGFLDDTRIKEPSYEGNGFHVLSRNRDKMPTGTIYLTKQAVTRAFAANKDLIYTLVLHQAAHIFHRWVLIRNGTDQDDQEMLQKFPPKVLELSCDEWAAGYTKRFLSTKYAAADVNAVMNEIATDYSDHGGYLVFDKTVISDKERKQAFINVINAKPPPGWPRP